jgi:hydroxyacylglutathione hydrolase
MIKIHCFTFNALQENTYILADETKECIIIDPGCYTKQEQEILKQFIADNQLDVKLLFNTHCHVDHVLGNHFVKTTYQVPLLISEQELPVLGAVTAYAPMYGFHEYAPSEPDQFISEKEAIHFGKSSLQVLSVPGHSVGHLAFYSKEDGFCVSGDVLFKLSIGRTDLPGGDYDTLMDSIFNKMYLLPDDTVIYAGHGDPTTIGYEKEYNYFVALSA